MTNSILPLCSSPPPGNQDARKSIWNGQEISEVKFKTFAYTRFIFGMTHKPRRNCVCTKCQKARSESGCRNPHKCQLTARKILNCLHPKWDPLQTSPPHDNLNLTPRRQARNKQAERNGGPVLFDPNVTLNSVKEGFHILQMITVKLPSLHSASPKLNLQIRTQQ
jgi:hypothetical protein